MSDEFIVAGHTYRATKLNAFDQFHVMRRLAPVLGSFKEIADVARIRDASAEPMDRIAALAPLADAVAKMADDDCEHILKKCLSVTQRQVEGERGWAPVWNGAASRPMYDDIDMLAMLQIVANVLWSQLEGFFSALPSGSTAAAVG